MSHYFSKILQDAEDLSFKKNDILVVVEQNEEKWWTAIDEEGNKGLIPEPYVKKVCTVLPFKFKPPIIMFSINIYCKSNEKLRLVSLEGKEKELFLSV